MVEKNTPHLRWSPFQLAFLVPCNLMDNFQVGTSNRGAAHSALQSIGRFSDVSGGQHHG